MHAKTQKSQNGKNHDDRLKHVYSSVQNVSIFKGSGLGESDPEEPERMLIFEVCPGRVRDAEPDFKLRKVVLFSRDGSLLGESVAALQTQ